jgi:hypothetical protein
VRVGRVDACSLGIPPLLTFDAQCFFLLFSYNS